MPGVKGEQSERTWSVMADITTYYTVRQDQKGELKLILARDPRVSGAKSPGANLPKPESEGRGGEEGEGGGGGGREGNQHSVVTKPSPASHGALHSDTTAQNLAVRPQVTTAAHKKQQVQLPMSRVRTIMKTNVKSSQNTLMIGQDSVITITKATELFIAELAKGACTVAAEGSSKEVNYKHLATAIRRNPDQMRFLFDILPEKVLAKDYLASLNRTDSDNQPSS